MPDSSGVPWLPDGDWGALRDILALLAGRADGIELVSRAADVLRPEFLGTGVTPGKRIVWNTGPTGAIFINGSEFTNGANVAHGLGVTPLYADVLNWTEDAGIFSAYVDWSSTNATNINWAAHDTRHLAHGPGNLAGSRFIAIGIK